MKKRGWLPILVAVVLAIAIALPVMAASSQDVTVTADPAFISVSNAPGTWTLNGLTGDSEIRPNTLYYSNPGGDTTPPSNPVIDGECRFTFTNDAASTVNVDIAVTMGNFSGGDANMTNGDDGTNGATQYGAFSWVSGDAYPALKQIIKTSGSTEVQTGIVPTGTQKWGAEVETQTNDWAGADASTATMTISATES